MKLSRFFRILLLAVVIGVVPASSYAAVFVSVGIAPPALPVYTQPPCPQPGYLWTPGYWRYGPAGYYWVPGVWVAPPAVGMLWTPPYWGFMGGVYVFHEGYWGPHVGYYGGINYGFGYMGVGFVGGYWHGGAFAYNRAVMNVNTTVVHNTYINRTVVNKTTINNYHHVAYSGGPGGIQHQPTPQEQAAMNQSHVAPTAAQTQHVQAAAQSPQQRFSANHGQPAATAMARPMTAPTTHAAAMNPSGQANRSGSTRNGSSMNRSNQQNGYRSQGFNRQRSSFSQQRYRARAQRRAQRWNNNHPRGR
jgi:hypothetical protein